MFEVLAALHRHSEARPQDRAFLQDDLSLTYAELAARVGGLAQDLTALDSNVIAIYASNGLEWVIADLAVACAGKTMVPLPTFFSPDQMRHVLANAEVGHILTNADIAASANALGLPVTAVHLDGPTAALREENNRGRDAGRIIYTSGTTGAPKGVRLGDRQIAASAKGLLAASGASEKDRYLSVLPFSLLLEQIAAIALPILAGAPVTIAPNAMMAALQGDTMALVNAFETAFDHQGATASVLVPGLLDAWVKTLAATGKTAPGSLRFVAVGGAPVNSDLAQSAWHLGVPVHEGYGLSECCSVVSVNRPGRRVAGSVGEPIPGLSVTLDDGEIVVHGDTVMSGYLGHDVDPNGVWRTGDLGVFTAEGALRIMGRKDNLIVTPAGRNISPEWVEGLCEANPTVAKAVLTQVDGHGLVLIVLASASTPDTALALDTFLQTQYAKLPDYARPDHTAIINRTDVAEHQLLTPLGDARRAQCLDFAQKWAARQNAA
ncbi:AMP-binding protein [Magnetovibrio sp.]|uniref:AMP-binding protein n=1 Tax=Magnetovibrio sp. TaxID=2024836 RepID=UPI002F92D747